MHAVVVLIVSIVMAVSCDEHEYNLYMHLLKEHTSLERPVVNHSHTINVTISLILQQIVMIDEKNQMLHSNVWIKYAWHDYKMVWEPSLFGGIKDIRLPYDHAWHPDILVYNSANPSSDNTYPSNIEVRHDGSMLYIPPGLLTTTCKIDITFFPFDSQQCYIKFGSWSYHGLALDLQPSEEGGVPQGIDTSEYMPNGEWLLLDAPVKRTVKRYACCEEPYVDVKYYFHIRRRTLYYSFNLILPSLLISLMTLLGFRLPPDAGEKITLEVTILLSICFFLSIVTEMTPSTSEAVPLLGIYFTACLFVVSASVMFTVGVLNLHFRSNDTHVMADWQRRVLLNWLPTLLRHPARNRPSDVEESSRKLRRRGTRIDHHIVLSPSADGIAIHSHRILPHKPISPADATDNRQLILMQRIYDELHFMASRMSRQDADDDAEADWKFAALLVDRLCFYLFAVFVGVSSSLVIAYPYLSIDHKFEVLP